MIKSALVTLVASLTLATNANAQLGQFPTSGQINAPRVANQMWVSRVNYAYMTGYDGFAPGAYNPNNVYVSNGLGVVPAWSTAYPYCAPNFGNYPVIAAPYGGGCAPVPPPVYGGGCYPGGGGYGGGSWGVGIGGGVGQTIYGKDRVTTWGVGVNVGVGGWSGW